MTPTRSALDSTYLRMTVCFLSQEPESRLAPDDEQKADLAVMMKDLEAMLARGGVSLQSHRPS